jgi:hypothetical protein
MTAAARLDIATIQEYCRILRLATVAAQCERRAQDAVRQQHSPLAYLASLLAAEVDERERRTIRTPLAGRPRAPAENLRGLRFQRRSPGLCRPAAAISRRPLS